jgi:hypothetical protein
VNRISGMRLGRMNSARVAVRFHPRSPTITRHR